MKKSEIIPVQTWSNKLQACIAICNTFGKIVLHICNIYNICTKSVYKPITDMYRYRPIIGFADMENPYRYRLSVSANTSAHIGSLTDILYSKFLNKNYILKEIM